MKIYLHEITDVETELEVDETDAWLAQAVAQADEAADASDPTAVSRPAGVPSPHAPGARKIRASLNLRKVDDVVVAQGSVDTHIQLVCSRCANVFQHKMSPSFSA